MRQLVIGCGYLGQRVAQRWQAEGHDVLVLTRSASRAESFRRQGWQPIIGDVLDPQVLAELPPVDVALWAVGLDRSSGRSQREVYIEGLQNVLKNIANRVRRFLYVSSTSVYGQDDGSVVDETSPTQPTAENGQVCLAAEQVVWDFFPIDSSATSPNFTGACIVRLAGIYGPGRLIARAETLRARTPLTGNPEAWLNLIHVDDAATAALACAERGIGGQTYLICDDRPLSRREFYSAVSRLVQAPEPVFAEPSVSSSLNKRCSNVKLRKELRVELQFPTIDVGLPHALVAADLKIC